MTGSGDTPVEGEVEVVAALAEETGPPDELRADSRSSVSLQGGQPANADTSAGPNGDTVSTTVSAEDDSLDIEVELIVGITRAVGTPSDTAMEQLRNSLTNYGYEVVIVKVSDLLQDSLESAEKWPEALNESERVNLLIEEGNRLNLQAEREDELAIRAVNEIQDLRRQHASGQNAGSMPPGPSRSLLAAQRGDNAEAAASENPVGSEAVVAKPNVESEFGPERVMSAGTAEASTGSSLTTPGDNPGVRTSTRRAYLIDSLKRPAEVTLLRGIYGDHFVLIGLQASAGVRTNLLISKLATQGERENAPELAQELIDRDNHEEVELKVLENGDKLKYGQDMLVTFPMSDVFINVDDDHEATRQVRRAIQLLFGDPDATGPDLCELGLQLATQTAARSTELGLRVGAVIMNEQGDVLSVGTNRHPIETTSPDFDAGALDIRQLVRATMSYLVGADILVPEEKAKLEGDSDSYVRALLSDVLAESDLKGLTEYQRAVHAEMDALISAVRQRVDLTGACVYVTNYPCHGCAKHLIALGLRVVFLEPYAKGKAESMYGDATLTFVPFTGVAPRRFDAWFVDGRSADRKDKSGMKIHWKPEQKAEAVPNVTPQISMASKHLRENFAIRR